MLYNYIYIQEPAILLLFLWIIPLSYEWKNMLSIMLLKIKIDSSDYYITSALVSGGLGTWLMDCWGVPPRFYIPTHLYLAGFTHRPYIMTDNMPYLSNVPPTYMGNLMKIIPFFRKFNCQNAPLWAAPVPTIFYVPPSIPRTSYSTR